MCDTSCPVPKRIRRPSPEGWAQMLVQQARQDFGPRFHPDGDFSCPSLMLIGERWRYQGLDADAAPWLVRARAHGHDLPLAIVGYRREERGHPLACKALAAYLNEAGVFTASAAASLLLEEYPILSLVSPGTVLPSSGGKSTPVPWKPLLEFFAEGH